MVPRVSFLNHDLIGPFKVIGAFTLVLMVSIPASKSLIFWVVDLSWCLGA